MTEEQIQEIERIKKRVDWHGSLGLPDAAKLIKLFDTLQQQNKQLIEALEEIKDEEWRLAGEFTTIYTTAYHALQQIQGNGEES